MLIVSIILPTITYAQDVRFSSNAPIEITSQQLEIDDNKNIAIFTGKVHVIRENTELKADKITVYYHHDQKQYHPKKITATHNVELTEQDYFAKGDELDYIIEDELIELRGDVSLVQNNNLIKGTKLTYNLKTGKSKLMGDPANSKQVKLLFTPDKNAH
jgi:lipopolysaccharide export system protein LptA